MKMRVLSGFMFILATLFVRACGSSIRYSSSRPSGSSSAGGNDGYVNDSPVAKTIAAARDWLGTPYKYGGTTRQGIDCSALMMFVFREGGKNLPRTSRQQFMVGQSVERTTLRPGDLVFFNTNGRGISHVGLFIGNNAFIHASSSRGVVRETLNSPYFANRYMGARRVH